MCALIHNQLERRGIYLVINLLCSYQLMITGPPYSITTDLLKSEYGT